MIQGDPGRIAAQEPSEDMGFFRQQQVDLAVRLLKWQYQRAGKQPPTDDVLRQHADQLVDDAHRIAKEKGRNVMAIIRELADDLKRR